VAAGPSVVKYVSESLRLQGENGAVVVPSSLPQDALQPSVGRCRSLSGQLVGQELHVLPPQRLSFDSQELPTAQFAGCSSSGLPPRTSSGVFSQLEDASPASSELGPQPLLGRQVSGSEQLMLVRQVSGGTQPPQRSILGVAQALAAAHGGPHPEAHVVARDTLHHASPVIQAGSPRLSRAWSPPPPLGVGASAATAPLAVASAVLGSPTAAAPPMPAAVLGSPTAGPVMCRTISGGSAHSAALGSPSWTTVTTRRKSARGGGGAAAEPGPPPPAELTRLRTEGDTVDLYYSQKDVFHRGWSRDAKQSWSVKAKRKTDYQVDKRRQQSMRDRAAMAASMAEEAADDFD